MMSVAERGASEPPRYDWRVTGEEGDDIFVEKRGGDAGNRQQARAGAVAMLIFAARHTMTWHA